MRSRTLRQLVDAGFDRHNMFQLTLLPRNGMCTDAYRRQHGLVTKWRVMPRCYGTYTVLGEELCAAELDEVCVTVPNKPYEDCREFRVMNLLLAFLDNGGVCAVLLAVLRAHRISPWAVPSAARRLGAHFAGVSSVGRLSGLTHLEPAGRGTVPVGGGRPQSRAGCPTGGGCG